MFRDEAVELSRLSFLGLRNGPPAAVLPDSLSGDVP